jgi:hypothetical protein
MSAIPDWNTQFIERARAAATPHDWPEHFAHENGMYQNRCCHCQALFTGHKRSPACRKCYYERPRETS